MFYPTKTGEGKSTEESKKDDSVAGTAAQDGTGGSSAETSSSESAKSTEAKAEDDKSKAKAEEANKEAEEESLSTYFKKNETQGRGFTKEEYKLQEGDYEEKDGKLVVKAKHLADDIEKYFSLKGEEVIRHVNKLRKANPEKAGILAKYLGFTLSDGTPDVDKFMSITRRYFSDKTPKDEAEELLSEFPEWVTDEDKKSENPFVFVPAEQKKEENKVSPNIPYGVVEVEDGLSDLVEIYNAKQEEAGAIKLETVLNNPKIFTFLKANKFNPETGELRPTKQILKMAFDEVYPVKKTTTKPEGGKTGVATSPNAKGTGINYKFQSANVAPEDLFYPKK